MKQLKGHMINFSIWGNIPTGQSFNTWPMIYLSLSLPNWTASHAYKVGDCITDSGFVFQCLTAGTTSSSKPAFNTTYEATYTDGTVIWKAMGYAFATNAATSFTASDGAWHRAVVGMYVPPTATGLTVSLYVWQQSGGQAGNVYWAEPALLIGNQAPDSVILSKEEMQAYVALGGNRIDFGSAIPTSGYCQQGDVRYNTGAAAGGVMGWMCITSGYPGTWKAMGNLSN